MCWHKSLINWTKCNLSFKLLCYLLFGTSNVLALNQPSIYDSALISSDIKLNFVVLAKSLLWMSMCQNHQKQLHLKSMVSIFLKLPLLTISMHFEKDWSFCSLFYMDFSFLLRRKTSTSTSVIIFIGKILIRKHENCCVNFQAYTKCLS